MPRQPRLDIPYLLPPHGSVRGIERRVIFMHNTDRNDYSGIEVGRYLNIGKASVSRALLSLFIPTDYKSFPRIAPYP